MPRIERYCEMGLFIRQFFPLLDKGIALDLGSGHDRSCTYVTKQRAHILSLGFLPLKKLSFDQTESEAVLSIRWKQPSPQSTYVHELQGTKRVDRA